MVLFQNQFSLYGNISRFPICRYFRNADKFSIRFHAWPNVRHKKWTIGIYFNPQSRLIVSSSLAYLNITSSLKMELSLSLSLYRVFIINIAYLIDCLILIKWNTIIMTDYVSIVRNADIFTKSYKSNISESQKSAFLKYRHNIPTTFADF